MDWWQAVILALVQGLTEFLPVSSSAHLILVPELLGWADQGLAFDVMVHVGTLVAVMFYFRRDIWNMALAWFGSLAGRHNEHSRLAWFVIMATIPACVFGLLANHFEEYLRSPLVIAATTIGFGLLLAVASKLASNRFGLPEISWQHALLIGCAQALAIIPGTSRSGITITAALLLGYKADAAARFSFLLSIPIILLAGGFKGLEWAESGLADTGIYLIVGAVTAAISAYVCIHYFLKLLDRIGMMPFVWYRLGLGLVLLYLFS